jgi:sugar O-acyltransferase (sialic acid O-acetyltransferase NeuD family)
MSERPLVVFGTEETAELAIFYFGFDGARVVEAVTVDGAFLREDHAFGLPVVAFEEVERSFPPDRFDLFVAVGYSGINRLRAQKCAEARARGYELASYVSPRATTFPDLDHGWNCFIFEDNTIQPRVRIGNNVTLWSGNHIGHHATIEDNVFIASHVVVSGGVVIGENSFIGVNATLRDHIRVGRFCVLGAGTILLADAPDETVFRAVATEPAKVPSSRLRRI